MITKATHEAAIEKVRTEYQLQDLRKQLSENSTIKSLQDQVKDLNNKLEIEKSKNATIQAEAKSSYAEHVLKTSEEHITTIRSINEKHSQALVEIAKATHTAPPIVHVVPVVGNNTQG
jgi:hypothetical protein